MGLNWPEQATEQLDFYWQHWRPPLDGLSDAECFWEPVDGCWSVRPVADGFAMDWLMPEPDPPPFTTLAWRLCHIAGHLFDLRASNHFGDGTYRMDNHDHPGSAHVALDYLDDSHARWRTATEGLREEEWASPVGPAEGPYADMPFATLVLHLNRELFHHGAEVSLLRDLYAATTGGAVRST
jgi:hypothetical protein